jgi:hypothetical protein
MDVKHFVRRENLAVNDNHYYREDKEKQNLNDVNLQEIHGKSWYHPEISHHQVGDHDLTDVDAQQSDALRQQHVRFLANIQLVATEHIDKNNHKNDVDEIHRIVSFEEELLEQQLVKVFMPYPNVRDGRNNRDEDIAGQKVKILESLFHL